MSEPSPDDGTDANLIPEEAASDEELHTIAEKESWLRARGVEIESVEDRRKAAEAKAKHAHVLDHVEGITRRVKYVKIPCDSSKPFEQKVCIVAHDAYGDVLPDVLSHCFAGGGVVDSNSAREQAVRQFGEKGLGLSQSALENATKQGSTETFALVRPSSTNGHKGVYMYLDEVGLLKKLPRNERAEGLSESCGFKGVHFYGDMYVGAIRAEPSPMRNVDFAVNDLDSSSDWLRRAASENVLHDQSMDQLRDAMRGKGGAASGGDGDGGMPGGEGGNYRWSQTDDSIELIVDVPLGTRAKDVSVAFKPSSFSVSVRGADAAAIAVPKTYRATRPDESTWTMDDGKVVVTIAKMDEQVWYGLEGLP